ncbi:MAG: hypothetical protein OXR72_16300 [Gemmatimonadota bacterium]|nr:hypothetical protein [Gemmatimonadota bacterium]
MADNSILKEYQIQKKNYNLQERRRLEILETISGISKFLEKIPKQRRPAFNLEPGRSNIGRLLSKWPTKDEINDLLALPNLIVSLKRLEEELFGPSADT